MAALAFGGETDIAFGDLMGLAPGEVSHDAQIFRLNYLPIYEDDRLDGILILGEDVTEQRNLAAAADREAKRNKMLLSLLGNQNLFANFTDECESGITRARELLASDPDGDGVNELFRIVHTIKGSAASLNMAELAEYTHHFEEDLDRARQAGALSDRADTADRFEGLVTILTGIQAEFSDMTGGSQSGTLIEPSEEERLRSLLSAKDSDGALALLDQLHLPMLSTYLGSKARLVVEQASEATGKEARLDLDAEAIRVPGGIIKVLEGALPRLLRNAVDHGIEDEDIRLARKKDAVGTITVQVRKEQGELALALSDDGGGIDPDGIRIAAVEKGLLDEDAAMAMSDDDARMMIFAPGFSTAASVSAVSGRGVGMDAVKQRVE